MQVRQLHEPNWDTALSALLCQAVSESGCTRAEIGKTAAINKDSLRRILNGERPATFAQAFAILHAAKVEPYADLILFLASGGAAVQSFRGDISQFLEGFLTELMPALERTLGNQLGEIKPRWAKGAAHRLARILADHIDELERRDALATTA
jgi:hypothetical protein